MIIPLLEWMPDLATDKGDQKADNVIPDQDFYRPWPSLNVLTNSLSSRCQGAIAVEDFNKLRYNYAGDKNFLYRLIDDVWTDASRVTVSATYDTATDEHWEFVFWANTVIATNFAAVPQRITLGGTNFVHLPGDPPRAKHIATVRDFVWLGNLPSLPQRVQWSAINNSDSWTVNASTQADFQDLPGDGGHIQKLVGGNIATIFQQRAIWRAHYVGPPAIFDFGTGPVERNLGALSPQSVVGWGPVIFYLSEDGFRMFTGNESVPIGSNKVDRTFFADLDTGFSYRVQAAIDAKNKLYVCAYPGAGHSGGNPNKIMVYSWISNRWTIISEESEFIFRFISAGYTLEGLDAISTSLDLLPDSLDSSLWAGGDISLALFNTSHRTALFTGTAKNATVDTVEHEHIPGRRARVARVRPLVEGLTSSVAALRRNDLAMTISAGTAVAQNSTGDCPMRSNGRYHRYRITTSGNFEKIRGVYVHEVSDGGDR